MSNFMKAFDEQRDSYLAHYGVKGMQWGVRNEEEPVGQQPAYSEQDAQSMKQTADKVRNADADSVKEKRKRIVKNIVKGVAIGAIVAGITVGAVKGYAKKQTGEEQDLATSLGIIGQKISKKPGQIGDAVKKGFNMNTEETLKNNQEAAKQAAQARRDAVVAKFNTARTKVSDMLTKMQEAKENKEAFKNVNIPFGKASDSNKIDMKKIAEERAEKAARESFGKIDTSLGPNFKKGTKYLNVGEIYEDRAIRAAKAEELIKKQGFKLKNVYHPKGYVETKNSRVYKG